MAGTFLADKTATALSIATGAAYVLACIVFPLSLAALMGLMVTWGQIRNTQSRDVDMNCVLLLLSVTCLQALCLVPLYSRFGWHVLAKEMVPLRISAEVSVGLVARLGNSGGGLLRAGELDHPGLSQSH